MKFDGVGLNQSLVFLSVHLQTAIAQHDGHGDEQQLRSLDVQRQAEEHARRQVKRSLLEQFFVVSAVCGGDVDT